METTTVNTNQSNLYVEVRETAWASVLFDICDWWINHLWMPYFLFSRINRFCAKYGWQQRVNGGKWELME